MNRYGESTRLQCQIVAQGIWLHRDFVSVIRCTADKVFRRSVTVEVGSMFPTDKVVVIQNGS